MREAPRDSPIYNIRLEILKEFNHVRPKKRNMGQPRIPYLCQIMESIVYLMHQPIKVTVPPFLIVFLIFHNSQVIMAGTVRNNGLRFAQQSAFCHALIT
ncbi:hypothetical protein A4A49_02844 [Nicotiana attenuata]|uniref:Uncharacterized protein n=1 Tax=Nicotiana attenuata TaxID=49451 RepID=A0A1J6IKJ7_NICAT|nr:hypothetical protein A4A49_02844 [Nicotiana attenuata]